VGGGVGGEFCFKKRIPVAGVEARHGDYGESDGLRAMAVMGTVIYPIYN
jgi:hypothetical protein